ncbi:MAG TPA: metallophosphoesterase family protein [Bacteroidia bacterium]|nr:metallophosphoesterase family protein [Bacteroidia bacterium]HNU34623.1 metallophosphoesterase family protein [Bacteroidia bacterium]
MKKILLVSDTHGYVDEVILRHAATADEVWHAGDIGTLSVINEIEKIKPIRAVYGNIDGYEIRSAFKETEIFHCENLKVFITHIGGYPGAYAKGIKEKLLAQLPDIFICGHSHILKVSRDKAINNLLHLNPGAAGRHGFHKLRTMLKFSIEGKTINDLNVIEIEK